MSDFIAYSLLIILVFGCTKLIIKIYNNFILLKNNIDKNFANIDVVLKQRNDEVPNLVKVVKEATKYESQTLSEITKIRAKYLSASQPNQKIKLANELTRGMNAIIVENYPMLKANESFLKLQRRLTEIENIIANRRETYNDSVNLYNIATDEFPGIIFSCLLGFRKRALLAFPPEELQNIKISK